MDCGAPQAGTPGSGITVASTAATLAESGPPATTDAERQLQLQELLVAATLGEFEILGELGRGGMATVYLAHDLALDRKVAIKVIAPGLLTAPGASERFKREARTAAGLSHPHIIPIHSVRETPALLYFVMKFVEGRPLDEILRERGPLPIRMIQAILGEVGQALAYAHRRGVVHRDIKPANVMLDSEGWAMVTDFGIAKVMESDALTVSGTMIGTPFYMSPEQCAGKPVSGLSDQYSLGVVAYEMLTGHPPFSGDTIMEIMKGHFFEAPRPVTASRPDCPPPLVGVVGRMLAKEPSERWTSMDEAVAAMDATPLAADDPVRSEMMELARSSESLKRISRLSVPVSPIPKGWSRARPVAASGAGLKQDPVEPAGVEPEEAAEAAPPAGWKTALAVGLGIALLAGAGAGAALYFRGRAPPTEAMSPPPPPSPDAGPVAGEPAAAEPAAPPPSAPPAPPAAGAPPATSAVAPEPTAEELAARRLSDAAGYVTTIEELLQLEWARQSPADGPAGQRARYLIEVAPNGTLGDIINVDRESPLDRVGFDLMTTTLLPPLPRSLGRQGLKLSVTLTPGRVRVTQR